MTSSLPEESVTAARPPPAVTGKRAARGRYRDALRHRDLRLLIASFLVDQIGSWSYIIVISVYIFDRTHSTQWLAANAVCRYVGELGLLHGIPRTASVRTRTPSTLLRIGGQDFLSALQVSQPSPALLSVAGTRMARTPRNFGHEPR